MGVATQTLDFAEQVQDLSDEELQEIAGELEGEEDLAEFIDFLLKVGASMDMVTPLWAMFQDAVRGPHSVFMVAYDACAYSGREIAGMLNAKGIENWGWLVVWDTLMFSVAERHVRWAQSVLQKAGVPVEGVA